MSSTLIAIPHPAIPKNGNFSGHETFSFRYAWLKKGIDGLSRRPDIFAVDEAMVELGVGKNMVRSIRHWCLATTVATESIQGRGLQPSELGRALFLDPGWDKYLEDDGTLWLLHWCLANNMVRATTWYWAFNLLKEQEFTRESLATGLERFVESNNWSRVAIASLKSDVSCFLRTYVAGKRGVTSTMEDTLDCPLVNLGLIVEVGNSGRYRFNTGSKPGLPGAIFTYALLDCWHQWHDRQETLSLREIVYGEGSPGRIFRLDDTAVLAYLDNLSEITDGCLIFDDTAITRQVRRIREITGKEVLSAYYLP